jgi:hypothetical protein
MRIFYTEAAEYVMCAAAQTAGAADALCDAKEGTYGVEEQAAAGLVPLSTEKYERMGSPAHKCLQMLPTEVSSLAAAGLEVNMSCLLSRCSARTFV